MIEKVRDRYVEGGDDMEKKEAKTIFGIVEFQFSVIANRMFY